VEFAGKSIHPLDFSSLNHLISEWESGPINLRNCILLTGAGSFLLPSAHLELEEEEKNQLKFL
jgi:hypothetical protein